MRQRYRRRRDLLHRELLQHLGGLLDVRAPEAGMHLVGWLPPGQDDSRASALAARHGVTAPPVTRYSLEPLPRGGLILGFASTAEDDLRLGVSRLAAALEAL